MPVKPDSIFTHCEDIRGNIKTRWSFTVPDGPDDPVRFSHAERRRQGRNGRWAFLSAWKAEDAKENPPADVQHAADAKVADMFMRLRRRAHAAASAPEVTFCGKLHNVRFETSTLVFHEAAAITGTRVYAWDLHRYTFSARDLDVLRSVAPKRSDMLKALGVYPQPYHSTDMKRRTFQLFVAFPATVSGGGGITLTVTVSDAEAAIVKTGGTAWRAVTARVGVDTSPLGEPSDVVLKDSWREVWPHAGRENSPVGWDYPGDVYDLDQAADIEKLYDVGAFTGRPPKRAAQRAIYASLGKHGFYNVPDFDPVPHGDIEWKFRLLPADPWSYYNPQGGVEWKGTTWRAPRW